MTMHTMSMRHNAGKMERVPYQSARPLFVPWTWHGWLVEDVALDNELELLSIERELDPPAGRIFCADDGVE